MDATIQLTKLRLDGGTQPRVKIDLDVVRDYAERSKAGDDFPPVDVFHDGAEYWLAEGFHRYHAQKENGGKTISCRIRKGTVRDAVLFSCGVNSHHGLRRTTADKQKAVRTLLCDAEWSKNSDRWIADACGVGADMVGTARRQLSESDSSNGKRLGKDGKSRPATQPAKPRIATVEDAPEQPKNGVPPMLQREPGDDTESIKAEQAKRRASGKETVSAKHRAICLKAFKMLVKLIDSIGIHDECRPHLDALCKIFIARTLIDKKVA